MEFDPVEPVPNLVPGAEAMTNGEAHMTDGSPMQQQQPGLDGMQHTFEQQQQHLQHDQQGEQHGFEQPMAVDMEA